MHVNMEEEEKQRMEDFVRDLFSKTEDFNLLTKKIVRKKYLQHSQKDSLNPQQKSIFADIIVKLLFEFNVGKEESETAKKNQTITPPAAQEEKSGVPKDGKIDDPGELSKSAQKTQPEPLLSRRGSGPKVENETSLDASVTAAIELKEEEDVEEKSELSKTAKKSTIKDVKGNKWSALPSRPTKRILSRQILINNFRDKVKRTSPCKRNNPSPFASATTISKHPLTDNSQKLTNDKEVNEEAPVKTTSLADESTEKKQQKAVTKRLSAFEVLQSVLEDSNDGSILSKSDLTDDDRGSAPRSSPVCESLPDREDSLIPLEEISDSTPTRRRLASKRLLESDSESMGGFTPPTKIKRIISSDSDNKNSPIRMRLFRNRIVDYSIHVPSATEKRKSVIESDSETQSPVKLLELSDQSTGESNSAPLVVKGSSRQKNKASKYADCAKAEEIKERKTVKPFRISISKKEILKNTDSESETEGSPLIKEKKTKVKRKKKTSKYKANSNDLASSSSSCDTDDLKLSQIKSLNQKQKQESSSDSDSELLINFTSGRLRNLSTNFKVPTVQKNSVAADGLKKNSVAADGLKKNSVAADGLKKNSVVADGLKKNSVAADGLKKNSVAADGLKKNSVAADGLKKNSVAADGLKKNSIAADGLKKNSIAVDGLQPKLKIIHEKSAMDSDSDCNAKKQRFSPRGANVGKLRIIRENAVDSDSNLSKNMHICDTAQSSSPDKTPQKVRRKSKPQCAQVLNSDSDSDLGLRIILSTSSDSEDVPLSKKKKESQTTLQSASKSLGTSAIGGGEGITVETENCSQKVSLANSSSSNSKSVDTSRTTENEDQISAALAYIKSVTDSKRSMQLQPMQKSSNNESSYLDMGTSSDESDSNVSHKTNKNNDNSVYSEDDNDFVKDLKSKQLIIRLERIQATSPILLKPDPASENLFTTSSCRTTTSDDNAEETSHPEVGYNGISSDSDISSLSDSPPNVCQNPSITNHIDGKKAETKIVPAESEKLKHLRKICRAAELFVNYKKEFQDLESDPAKCRRLEQILKDAGMKGRPTFKAAERIRLLREAKELNEENIISCDSGRPRRKVQDLFTVKSPKNVIHSKPEQFTNLVGIVDSEGSESDMEFN